MCLISLYKKKKTSDFLMYCLSVYLIQIQSYRAFSKMAVDHWCLSLRGEVNIPPLYSLPSEPSRSIRQTVSDQGRYNTTLGPLSTHHSKGRLYNSLAAASILS